MAATSSGNHQLCSDRDVVLKTIIIAAKNASETNYMQGMYVHMLCTVRLLTVNGNP